MATEHHLPDEYQEIVEKYYYEPYGELPPVLASRIAVGAKLAPEFNLSVETVRANALFSDVLDRKTTNLIVLGILAGAGTPGCYLHVKAARKYGATWEEIFKTAEIAMFINGNKALVDVGQAIARVHEEENTA